MGRKLDSYCDVCNEVRPHEVQDPGSCKCVVCGKVQLIIASLREA
ncbi:MAG: hypothetical protein AABY18_05555 [Candidatus Thermoplasmatota archaeon]